MRQTLVVLVENSPGVLARVAGLFSRRGFNIESLAVGVTEDPGISRMTILVDGDDAQVEQVEKQLHKLINVLKVSNLSREPAVQRELALIKVGAEPGVRAAIIQIAGVFRAKVVDVGKRTLTMEITGDSDKVEALLQLLREYGIRELARTGCIAMVRGGKVANSGKSEKGDGEDS